MLPVAHANDPEPVSQQLFDFTAQAHQQLQGWRLLVGTAYRPYANLLELQLSDPQPAPPMLPQRLVAVCDSVVDLRACMPDAAGDVLVFCELTLRDGSVLPLFQDWKRRETPPRLLLSMAAPLQPALVREAWRIGVDALVCSDDYGKGELLRALVAVGQGQRYRGPAFDRVWQSAQPAGDALSRRELEVLPLLADGLTNRQIAERLQIAEVTARDHVQRILQKLQVSDRAAAAALAVRLGLVR